MINAENLYLSFSVIIFISAACNFLYAFLMKIKKIHDFQICINSLFLLLAAALVVLSSLHMFVSARVFIFLIDIALAESFIHEIQLMTVHIQLHTGFRSQTTVIWQMLSHDKKFVKFVRILMFLISILIIAFMLR